MIRIDLNLGLNAGVSHHPGLSIYLPLILINEAWLILIRCCKHVLNKTISWSPYTLRERERERERRLPLYTTKQRIKNFHYWVVKLSLWGTSITHKEQGIIPWDGDGLGGVCVRTYHMIKKINDHISVEIPFFFFT